MPIQQLPLMKGVGKDFRNADYIDYLPVNMLATPKEILNSSGYLRSFPGIAKRSDVNGVSRGVEYNMRRVLFIACVVASCTKEKMQSVMLPEVVAYQWRMVEHHRR